MMLLFDQRKLPRTMNRKEWRGIDRWRRVTQHKLREAMERQVQALSAIRDDLGAYGTATHLHAMERLINPPVLIGPGQ
jgi:hypothetical protein